ncbi:hypothetical protein BBF96_00400 [Anoxybacter fermentans]|uniref:ABC transporter permease n=1 Tax=Anoxybacter fermentans TaxID=1323375 RepID=A0A3S9SUJ7_9FIRM|nr:ABC transporter permease [Anoxybacter fermentans]AZR71997.1 hypothetical protein BBF96_00400 [Anoxybacter fermentans]
MIRLLRVELLKIIKMKQIYLNLVGAILFGLIIFLNYIGESEISAFEFPIGSLSNLTQTFVIIIFLGFSSYIYGIEIQEKTLKILHTKPIPAWKVVLVKFFVGIIYTFLLLFSVGFIVFIIASIFYPLTDFPDQSGSNIIPVTEGINYIVLAYFMQGLALIFVTALCITLSIILDSPVMALILTFFVMLFSFIAGNVEFIRPVLPTTHWLIWREIIQRKIAWGHVWNSLMILGIYSFILFGIAVYAYRLKEVKI